MIRIVSGLALVGAFLSFAGDVGALPSKQSNAGDSISQGFDADDLPWDHPGESWIQGTDPSVASVFTRYSQIVQNFSQEPESVTGAELVGGGDSFAAQASRICAQSQVPDHVSVLLGANDVCNRDSSSTADATANMYSLDTWISALEAGFDQLAACLPADTIVQVISMPRVDFLYEAGHDKSWWCYDVIWPTAGVCRITTAETDAGRRAQIGARIDEYNASTTTELETYNANTNGKNPKGIRFVGDWQGSIAEGHQNTSFGTYQFTADDINIVDCFHPNESGQAKLACVAWATNPEGDGTVAACLE